MQGHDTRTVGFDNKIRFRRHYIDEVLEIDSRAM
jgi:hypothetical protein